MKRSGAAVTLSIAAFSFALLSPKFAEAQHAQSMNTQASQSTMDASSTAGRNEAQQMVPARAALLKTLDAKDVRPGEQFTAKLSQTVHLKNGPELPNGTELIGVVSTDHMQNAGTSRLALRFTEAKLKDGQVVPIKATIVGVYGPEAENYQGYDVQAGDQQPNLWNQGTLQVDQIGAISGVDLHSKIASRNSAVFVSSKKDDVKLKGGSELTLAIAANEKSQSAMNSQNHGD